MASPADVGHPETDILEHDVPKQAKRVTLTLPAGGSSGQVDAHPVESSGTTLVHTLGGFAGVKAHVFGVRTTYVDENGNLLTVKRAFANIAAGTTDGNIISAVASRKLRILGGAFQCAAVATSITFNTKPAGAGVAISPLYPNGINSGHVWNRNDFGWLETTSGQGLTATTGVGSTTGILFFYVEVP